MIRTKGLNIGYSEQILHNIDLELNNGEVYILIGRNGSGKSTFLKTISAEITALSGSVKLDNIPVNRLTPEELSRVISIVDPTFTEVDYLTVFNYIALGRSPYTGMLGILKDRDRTIIHQVMCELNIEYLSERFTSEISDGERQLVSIARSLAQNTSNIILDEPTAFLDYRNKIQIMDVLKGIAFRDNKCIIVSSHDIDIAIASGCPFLIVQNNEKTIDLHSGPFQREEILESAF